MWLAERVAHGWVPLALMFSVGYHVIPMTAKQPIWSGSMRSASMLLLFITIPPFFMTDAPPQQLVTNLGAILLTLGVLPIFAASINLLMTASSGLSAVVKQPGAVAATMAFLVLPFFAIGGYFTAMDTFVGTGELGSMGEVVNMSMLFTVGGLLVLAGVFTNYPNAIESRLQRRQLLRWRPGMVLVGGVASTLTYLTGRIHCQRRGFPKLRTLLLTAEDSTSPLSAVLPRGPSEPFFNDGRHSNRHFRLGRSVAVEETSDMAKYTPTSGSSTTIRRTSSAEASALIPPWSSPKPKPTRVAQPSSPTPLFTTMRSRNSTTTSTVMVDFMQYLTNTEQSVFQLFRSMDLDDSAKLTAENSSQPSNPQILKDWPTSTPTNSLNAWTWTETVSLNLPELDIAIAQIKRDHDITLLQKRSEFSRACLRAHRSGRQTKRREVHVL